MAISATCPFCAKVTRIKDELAGKKFKCADCGTVVDIPGTAKAKSKTSDKEEEEDEFTPARKSRRSSRDDNDEDDDDSFQRRGSGSNTALWVAGGAGLAVLCLFCVCVVPIYLVMRTPTKPQDVAARPFEQPPFVPPAPPPFQPAFQPAAQPMQPLPERNLAQNNAMPNINPAAIPMPPAIPLPPPIPVPARPSDIEKPVITNEPARDWTVKVDPPAEVKWVGDKVKVQVRIPARQLGGAIFAQGPSPFVCVGASFTDADIREVWDLSTMKKLGTIRGISADRFHAALSPDGKYYAAHDPFKNTVVLWDVAKSKPIGQMKTPLAFFNWIDFAGADKLLVSVGEQAFVTKLPTGALDRTLELHSNAQQHEQGVSLGGKYLVYFERDFNDQKLTFVDLTTGESAGVLPVPSTSHGFMDCKGIGFSADGQEVAVMFQRVLDADVLIWDVATGDLKEQIALPKFGMQLKSAVFYRGHKMQWFPDKQRLLVHGFGVVDRREAKLVQAFSKDRDYPAELPRKVLNNSQIAIVHAPFAEPMTLVTAKVGE